MRIIHDYRVMVFKYDSTEEMQENIADMVVDGWDIEIIDEDELIIEYTKSYEDDY
jgi:hypothetical protein